MHYQLRQPPAQPTIQTKDKPFVVCSFACNTPAEANPAGVVFGNCASEYHGCEGMSIPTVAVMIDSLNERIMKNVVREVVLGAVVLEVEIDVGESVRYKSVATPCKGCCNNLI